MANEKNRDILSDLLIDAKVDGIIWANVRPNEQEAAILERRNLPTLMINSVDRELSFAIPKIIVDSAAGMHQAVKHLCDMGHEKIMLVSGTKMGDISVHDHRADYYFAAMDAAGLNYRKSIFGDFDENTAYDKMKEFMESGEEMPTAIISSSDAMAWGVIRALEESGLSVPGDISVIGYDDIYAGRHMQPALSTIKQQVSEAVTAAIDFIFECRDNKEIDREYVRRIDTELIIRESSGAVKK